MAELLIELFSEEIPARMQARAAEELKRLVTEKLAAEKLAFTSARAFVTPRRLALVVDGFPERQPDLEEERKGPRIGADDRAIQGFLKGAGLASLDQAERRDTGKGEFWFAVSRKPGRPTAKILPGLIEGVAPALSWPKSMRWAGHGFRWVRPLHSVLAMFGGKPLSGALDLGNGGRIKFSNTTRGHRFLAPKPFKVESFADYEAKLRAAFVMLDPEERKRVIAEQAERLAATEGLTVRPDPALLDEVAGLVEWPVVLMGRIDARFMQLPPEVLTATMRTNQKYLSLLDRDGKLAARFLVVANIEAKDGGKAIIAGNERVLRARLADAEFFWTQDRKQRLDARLPALGQIIFHTKLGTMADKVVRVEALAGELASRILGADQALVGRAATLAKADLVTGMVGEFPELQGIVGRYYALAEGERPEVADAIAEHYSPVGPNDRCPTAPVSVAVALADKIDTLVGFFAIGETPTGSKDPFGLRRAALGMLRVIIENGLRLPLVRILSRARDFLDKDIENKEGRVGVVLRPRRAHPEFGGQVDKVALDLLDFLADRLKVQVRERGVRHDLIAAVFALGGEDDFVRLLARVDALQQFLGGEDGANLLTAYRRAANILKIEEKKDGKTYALDGVDPALLSASEERTLHAELTKRAQTIEGALKDERFDEAMRSVAALRPFVDTFFDKVTVNADDPALRRNRLFLLANIRGTLDRVADFSRIEG